MKSSDETANLDQLKLNLASKLILNAPPIEQTSIDEILNHQFCHELIDFVLLKIDENDAGPNVIKILDHCFKVRSLLSNLYPKLSSTKSKYILIDYLTEKFRDQNLDLTNNDLNYLIEQFRKCLNRPFDENSQIDKVELVKLSDLMCLLSSETNNQYDRTLFNQNLIKLIVDNLFYCQTIGKQKDLNDDNPLKIISKLKQINDPDSFSKETLFGFKSNLIRLLGNFAYENRTVQDWIRELDAIALILDCTNMDARNPFIIQWSVFALRNILKDNQANQDFIRNLTTEDRSLKIDLSQIM